MHLPVTSKHGFHDYEIKADAIEAAQARSSEASQGRARFLDTEPYSLGPQPGRGPRGHWLWATPPVSRQGELTSRGNPESSPRASRVHGRETGPTAKRGLESTAHSGASLRHRAGGFHCVRPQSCARTRPPAKARKGESRRGERLPGECEEWSCVGVPEGLWPVPRLPSQSPHPAPRHRAAVPVWAAPAQPPACPARRRKEQEETRGLRPGLPAARLCPWQGQGDTTRWTAARRASGPWAGRAQRPSAVGRVSSDGQLWARHALQSCSVHGRRAPG